MKIQTKLALTSSTLLAAACTATLLWSTYYTGDPRSFGSTLTVDADGAVYAGGGVLEAPAGTETDAWWNTPAAVLAKYDRSGKTVWTQRIPTAGTIKSVHALDAARILVHGTPLYTDTSNSQASTLWIASATTGELILEIDRFDENRALVEVVVESDRIYVATTNAIDVFANDGTRIDHENLDSTILDLEVASDGFVFLNVELEHGSSAYQKRNAELDLLWQTPVEYFASPKAMHILANGDLLKLENGQVQRIDNQGQVVFTTSLDAVSSMSNSMWSGPYIYGSAQLKSDNNGDIYLATTIADTYLQADAVNTQNLYTNLVTSAALLKIDGNTGNVVWHDVIRSTPLLHTPDLTTQTQRFSNNSYWPIGLNITNDTATLTFNAFLGDYTGTLFDGKAHCARNIFDLDVLIASVCPLSNVRDAYARSITYNSDTGQRIKTGGKISGHIRDIVYDNTGETYVIGDNAIEIDPIHYAPIWMSWLTIPFNQESDWAHLLPGGTVHTDSSQMFVSKFK